MTAARQKRKRYRALLEAFAGLVLAGLLGAPAAVATERIVVNQHTGLAIDGYDPVAFYTDHKPVIGIADFELSYGGAVWRFRNIGNRAEFATRPDIYMPQFGGYDPVAVGHGIALAGDPRIWKIIRDRLFLFYDRVRLETFTADPNRVLAGAERKWADVLRRLGP